METVYKVFSKDGVQLAYCLGLDEAMDLAKAFGKFVIIQGPEFEVRGVFGVDSIKDGVCPDGIKYDWNKASRIGRVKRSDYNADIKNTAGSYKI
jgi:hypothetical protein